MFDVDAAQTAQPLVLVVDRLNVGGVPGLGPTVALRLLPTTNSYLDWVSQTFKTVGWATKFQPMTDLGSGIYQQVLNVAGLALPVGTLLCAEYAFAGAQGSGADADVFRISSERADAQLVRQYHTNRLAEASGNPGSLVLYQDDSVTPLRTHQLTDETGQAIIAAPGTPARRSVGT